MTKHLIVDSQIRHACEMNDLDDACLLIQNLLGVTDGGIASIVFSGMDWDNTLLTDRMNAMRDYIKTEYAYETCEDENDK
jgi:hypothetical protein